MAQARSISRTETAKLIRKALKREFSETKFSVRSKSYSGGGSITIQWVDGPTEKQVEDIAGAYESRGFDGMTDSSYHYNAWLLPNGSVEIASRTATGSMDAYKTDKPHPDAELVSFGTGFLNTNRFHSPELVRRVAAEISEQTGWDAPEIVESDGYWSRNKTIPTAEFKGCFHGEGEVIYREFANALRNTAEGEPAEAECVRNEREYQAWKAEQEQTEVDDENEPTKAITEATKADIAANREANDKQARLNKELFEQVTTLALDIIATTESRFIQLCVQRKVEALTENSPIKDLIQVGDDLVLMAEA